MENGSFTSNPHHDRLSTRLIHIGSAPDPSTGAVIPSISLATTYAQSAVGVHKGYEYARSLNPNRLHLETLIASLEGVDQLLAVETNGLPLPQALAVSSGSAATATVINALVGPGGHMISMADVYGGTYRYMTKVASGLGMSSSLIDCSTPESEDVMQSDRAVLSSLEAAIQPGKTKLVWIETPTNPTLRLVNIRLIAKAAHDHNLILVVDSTFMSPFYQQAIELGADVVVHSATKYINGHSDAVLGLIIARDPKLVAKMRFLQNAHGAVPSAFDCWLVQRGLKTLDLRMIRHGTNALEVAYWLRDVAMTQFGWVTQVIYPGFGDSKQHSPHNVLSSLAWAQIPKESQDRLGRLGYGPNISPDGRFPYGGMLSFRIATNKKSPNNSSTETFFKHLRIFTLAESLGGIESLVELPALMTHAAVSEEDRLSMGIDNQLIRVSVGLEDPVDLISDLHQSLGKSIVGEAEWEHISRRSASNV